MSKSPVYIGAGSNELTVTGALSLLGDAEDSAAYLLTIERWATLSGSSTVIDEITQVDSGEYSAKAYAQNTGDDIGSSKDWATLGTQVSSTDYSSKQYAVGTPPDGSAKEWAVTDTAVVADSKYSAKEYAQGTLASTGGSAKDYAQKVDGGVSGATSDHSAKAWAVGGTGVDQTASKGSSKDWAIGTGRIDNQTTGDYSAKEHATGTTVAEGSAKEWATNAGSAEVATSAGYSSKAYAQNTANNIGSSIDWATKTSAQVASTDYSSKEWATGILGRGNANEGSAKDWATRPENSAVDNAGYSALHWAAKSSASAVSAEGYTDAFDDKYLGSKISIGSITGLADYSPAPSGPWDGSSQLPQTGYTQTSTSGSGTSAVFTIVTDPSGNPTVTVTTVGSLYAVNDTIVLTDSSAGSTGETVTITVNAIGVHPLLDNDGDALTDGALYFNTTLAIMLVYDLGNTTWNQLTPTAANQTNINAVAADAIDIGKVAAIDTEIGDVAAIDTEVQTVAGIASGDVSKVAIIPTGDVTKVAIIPTGDVNKVAAIATGNVNLVAAIATGNVDKVAAIATGNVDKVAVIATGNVDKVAVVDGEVADVAAIDTEITTIVTGTDGTAGTGGTNTNLVLINSVHGKITEVGNLGTSTVVGYMTALNGTNVISNMAALNASGVIIDVGKVADIDTEVTRYATEYTIANSAPGSPQDGWLWSDTNNNVLRHYNGATTNWDQVSSAGISSLVVDLTPQLGGDLDTQTNSINLGGLLEKYPTGSSYPLTVQTIASGVDKLLLSETFVQTGTVTINGVLRLGKIFEDEIPTGITLTNSGGSIVQGSGTLTNASPLVQNFDPDFLNTKKGDLHIGVNITDRVTGTFGSGINLSGSTGTFTSSHVIGSDVTGVLGAGLTGEPTIAGTNFTGTLSNTIQDNITRLGTVTSGEIGTGTTISNAVQDNITRLGTVTSGDISALSGTPSITDNGNATAITIDTSEDCTFTGNLFPDTHNTKDLGSSAVRWANVWVADLHLANDRGDWTVIEEENYLTLRNNKTGKRFKLLMEELE